MKKSIKEVWKDIPQGSRNAIIGEVVLKGGASYPAVQTWVKEERKPRFLYMQLLADTINKHTGQEFTVEDLFPDK